MSVFDCNIKYKKVEGDSYTSTYNKLLSQGFIDKYLNVTTDVATLRLAKKELNNQAEAKLGYKVNLFAEKILLNGIRLIPDMKIFGIINSFNKSPKIDTFVQDAYIKSQIEGIDQFGDSDTNLIQRDLREYLGVNIDKNDTTGNRSATERNTRILSREFPKDFELLYESYDVNLGSYTVSTGISSDFRDTYSDDFTNFSRISGRSFSEIFSGKEFNTLERRSYSFLRLVRSIEDNSLNKGISRKLGFKTIKITLDRTKAPVYVENNSITINPEWITDIFEEYFNKNVNLDQYSDVVIFEELIHLISLSIVPQESLEEGRKQLNSVGAFDNIYALYRSPKSMQLYHEAIRMQIQKEFLGYATEDVSGQWDNGPIDKNSLYLIWKWLLDLFQKLSYPKELLDKTREYIKNTYEGDFKIDSVGAIYLGINQSNNSFIAEEKLSQTQNLIDKYNSLNTGKTLEILEVVKNKYRIKQNFSVNYLYKGEIPQLEELENIPHIATESTSNFNLGCIRN